MGLEDEENVPTIPFISTIHRKYGIFLNHNMKDYNLSFGQYPILIRLYDEGPSTQQNLAKIFQLNESTITRALNKLEEKEYIEKHPDYENKRKNYVKVTPKGAKIAKEVMDYDEQWDKICSENLSEKEFEEFKTTLKKTIEIYLIYTIAGIILYLLAGMPTFDSICNTFCMIVYNSFTFFE